MEPDKETEFNFTGKNPIKKYAFIFVCQKGKLEASSCMLAASLKKFVKVGYEMIVAIPGPESFFGKPDSAALNFLEKLSCRFFYFENDFVKEKKKGSHFLRANKIYAINAPTDAEKVIFLDSDQLCCENFWGDPNFFIPFSATMANHVSCEALANDIKKIYSAVDAKIPEIRFRVPFMKTFNRDRKEIYLPSHFCSAFVAIDSGLTKELSQIWLEVFRKINEIESLNNPYFSEEIALSLTVQKMRIPFLMLDFKWKYRKFLNYSALENIRKNSNALRTAKSILFEYPEIKKLVESDKIWHDILNNNSEDNVFYSNLDNQDSNSTVSKSPTEEKSGKKEILKHEEIEVLKPWMTDEEIGLIKSYLKKDKVFFEWGAGGSTIEFPNYVKEYYSVEHDFGWYNAVFKNAGENVRLFYIPPNNPDFKWFPVFEEGKASDFRSYIKFVNNIASLGKKFDLVLVDGRARVDCALEVLPHLEKDAVVFIHDFGREYYWKVLKYYEIVSFVDKMVALKIKKEFLNNDRIFLMKRFLMKEIYA